MRLFGAVVVAIALAQTGAAVTGDWTATYRGTTYVRLALVDGPAAPQGTISLGQTVHVDEDGNVDNATPPSATATAKRITNVRWNGAVLSFAIDDDGDVDTFEFRLIDADHAELQMTFSDEQKLELAGEHIPLPKPFPLTKAR
jgi:hypothetical protein